MTLLQCDTCGYVADSWDDANEHEDRNLDHWVQFVQGETNDNQCPRTGRSASACDTPDHANCPELAQKL